MIGKGEHVSYVAHRESCSVCQYTIITHGGVSIPCLLMSIPRIYYPMLLRFSLFIIAWLMCACTVHVSAQTPAPPLLALPDIELRAGNSALLELQLTVPAGVLPARIDSLRVRCSFTPSLVGLDSLRSNTSATLHCARPTLRTAIISSDSAVAEFTCSSLATIQSTTQPTATVLTSIFVRGLASRDSVAIGRIVPQAIFINGRAVANLRVRVAQVTVRGTPIEVFPVDGLGQNYPNAVVNQTVFPYSIADPTTVNFKVFDARGKMIYDFPAFQRARGRYEFPFIAPYDMASGMYFMQMTTTRGSFVKSFSVRR